MAWGSTYTATGAWQNAADAGAGCAVTFNVTLPAIPSGANGTVVVMTLSGGPPSGALSSFATTGVTVGGARSGSSGTVHAIVGHSIIA